MPDLSAKERHELFIKMRFSDAVIALITMVRDIPENSRILLNNVNIDTGGDDPFSSGEVVIQYDVIRLSEDEDGL